MARAKIQIRQDPVLAEKLCTPRSQKHLDFVWSNTDITVFGGAAGCLDGEAEYMSPNGWRKFKDYDGGLVTQYDAYSGETSLVIPKEYIKKPCEEMKRISARGLDFKLSDEHRVAYFNDVGDKDKIHVISFSEMLSRHNGSKTKGWTGKVKTTYTTSNSGVDLSEFQLRLQVAIQADGSFKSSSTNRVYIRFSKERKDERLRWILDSLGLDYERIATSDSRYSNGKSFEYRLDAPLREKVFSGFWYGCSQEQLEIIMDEVGYWDGTIVDSNNTHDTVRYFSNHKENVDFIQYAAHACGYNTSIVQDRRIEKYKEGEHYTLNCTKRGNGLRCFANKDGKAEVVTEKTSDGFKYCFSVPSTFLLVRYNSKIFITGNSGKTWQGLVRFLQFINEPLYQGYVIRKTQQSLKEGAFKTAIRIFTAWEPMIKVNLVNMTITFPSGAVIIFKGLDGAASIEYFQGQEISGALVDEATHIKYSEIEWLMTRLRSNADIKPTVWFTCNPDPDHFLAEWVDPYLYPKKTYIRDPETKRRIDVGGRVDPEKNGQVRWYYIIEGVWYWDTSRDALVEKCKHLIYDPKQKPMSFRFIGATCEDNPVLMEEQPDYKNRLLNKSRVEAERLAYGNWYVREEGTGYWKHDWCRKIKTFPVTEDDELPPDDKVDKRVRCWDLAWTEPHEANPDPDYTAGVLMFRTKKGYYVVEHVVRARMRAGSVYKYIAEQAKADYDMYGIIPQFIPEDPSAGKATFQFAKDYLMANGITAVSKVVGSKQNNKLERFKNFAAASEHRAVLIMEAEWNDEYFSELEVFDGTRNVRHDDMVDATSDAFNALFVRRKVRKKVTGNMF